MAEITAAEAIARVAEILDGERYTADDLEDIALQRAAGYLTGEPGERDRDLYVVGARGVTPNDTLAPGRHVTRAEDNAESESEND